MSHVRVGAASLQLPAVSVQPGGSDLRYLQIETHQRLLPAFLLSYFYFNSELQAKENARLISAESDAFMRKSRCLSLIDTRKLLRLCPLMTIQIKLKSKTHPVVIVTVSGVEGKPLAAVCKVTRTH